MQFIRFYKIIVLVILVLVNITARPLCQSQNQDVGKIKGIVVDLLDARITWATILIENKGYSKTIEVNKNGEYEMTLPAGKYRLLVTAKGFRKYTKKRVIVVANQTEKIDLKLTGLPPDYNCPSGRICL